ncbi:hypothetical protein FACS1894171_2830 [Clostridia bacterium]|nr:hypothetical protein FACS1894171_2830 [Clostridia bacterium]
MKILVYENTWNGFLSAVFAAFSAKSEVRLVNAGRFDGLSLYTTVRIEENPSHALRVEKGLNRLSRDMPEAVYKIWLTEFDGIEDRIVEALRLGFNLNRDPLPLLQHDCVKTIMEAHGKIVAEVCRFLGFVRFVRAPGELYVADIEPDCNILPLIAEHFHDRFRGQKFIIRDRRRFAAIVSGEDGWEITELRKDQMPDLPEDGEIEAVWKKYFEIIANPARINRKLQRQFVPLRYRGNLTEFQ